ncbi:winged helix DNA-binding domain-containing protein [Actinomadura craniellae]|uniref:winged helix DNA-binding domain-containing protein n=1 Tax=Actinomadura craniellae TaxID=2231787 RepID=UPI001313FC21|nr:winged helix DNA-binding domain-containing protein [Actinomadura craniellae]
MTDDAHALRVRAQLLHRPASGGVTETVRRLLAVQAQDIAAFPIALHARMPAVTAADLRAARDERSVVRIWGPRGTIHLIAAADLPWLFPLIRSGPVDSLRRLGQLGVRIGEAEAVRAVDRALAGQGPLTKAELGERLAAGGLPAEGQAIVHLAVLAARAGLLVFGPDRSNRPTYVHAADWLGSPVPVETDRERALAELARRYLRAHAPAGPRDLAAWSGLPLRDAETGWRAIAAELTEVSPGLWTAGADAADPVAEPVVRLLPIWDEYLLGWASTLAWAAPASYRPVIHSSRPVLLADGRVAATWRPRRTAGRLEITVRPLAPLADQISDLLAREADGLGRFLGLRTELAVGPPDPAGG